MYSQTFLLLKNEGHLLSGCIRSALKSLMRGSSAERGPLYVALFNYSIGLERLLKIAVILDHCVANRGDFPTWQEIKKIGHNLAKLHELATEACKRRSVEIPDSCATDDLDERLLDLLTGFADNQGRYFNLDALTGGGKSSDPLPEWGEILNEIYVRDISPQKRASDEEQVAAEAEAQKEDIVYVPDTNLDGTEQSYEEFFAEHGKIRLVMPEVVWRFARLLYPFQSLISELDKPLRSGTAGKPEDYPTMSEFCSFCSPEKEDTLWEIKEEW